MQPSTLLARLRAGEQIDEASVVVVAHPDDETIAMGARLNRFASLLLIHVTDGAPEAMADARTAGFETREGYAAARESELKRGLEALGATPRRISYGFVDQTAVDCASEVIDRLTVDLRDAAIVITHPFEGGHPDHDACALAVQSACGLLGARSPIRFEFACYHALLGRMATQQFWPDWDRPETKIEISPIDRSRKAAGLAAHASQAETLANFSPGREAYRLAPIYDFTRAPPPGAFLYDGFGFCLKGAEWLGRARAALALLSPEPIT